MSGDRQDVDDFEVSTKDGWAGGILGLGAVLLMLMSLFQFIEGLTAVLDNDLLVSNGTYVLKLNTTAWGWIHMVIAVIGFVVAVGVLTGRTWAFACALVIAGLSAVANFAFLPYYPAWGILIIALDVAVIWALTVFIRER